MQIARVDGWIRHFESCKLRTEVDQEKKMVKSEGGIWWVNGFFVVLTHMIGVSSLFLYKPHVKTVILMFALFQMGAFG
jgi:hypothetical protein